MMFRLSIATTLAFVSLCACGSSGPATQEDPAGDPTIVSEREEDPPNLPEPTYPSPETLIGEYRVAGIDGEPLDAAFGIALSIDEMTISYEPTCAGFVWNYSYAGGKLEIKRAPPINPPVDGVPAPVCAVAVPPELRTLGQALDKVVSAGRTPANGILLSGDARSVTLFSQ